MVRLDRVDHNLCILKRVDAYMSPDRSFLVLATQPRWPCGHPDLVEVGVHDRRSEPPELGQQLQKRLEIQGCQQHVCEKKPFGVGWGRGSGSGSGSGAPALTCIVVACS